MAAQQRVRTTSAAAASTVAVTARWRVLAAVVGVGVGVVGPGREDEPGAVGAGDGERAVRAAVTVPPSLDHPDLGLEPQPVVRQRAADVSRPSCAVTWWSPGRGEVWRRVKPTGRAVGGRAVRRSPDRGTQAKYSRRCAHASGGVRHEGDALADVQARAGSRCRGLGRAGDVQPQIAEGLVGAEAGAWAARAGPPRPRGRPPVARRSAAGPRRARPGGARASCRGRSRSGRRGRRSIATSR